jgi:hypothetical protein
VVADGRDVIAQTETCGGSDSAAAGDGDAESAW